MGSFLSTIVIVIARVLGFEMLPQAVSSSSHPAASDEREPENLLHDDEGQNAVDVQQDDDMAMDEGISDMDEDPDEAVAIEGSAAQKDVSRDVDQEEDDHGVTGEVTEKDGAVMEEEVAMKNDNELKEEIAMKDKKELETEIPDTIQEDVAEEVTVEDQKANDAGQNPQVPDDSKDSPSQEKETKTKSKARKSSGKSSGPIPSISPSKSNWQEDSRRPTHDPEGGVIPPNKKTKMEEEKVTTEQIHFETIADLHFGESGDFACPETLSPAYLTHDIENKTPVGDEDPSVVGSGDARIPEVATELGENPETLQQDDPTKFSQTKANVLQDVPVERNEAEAIVHDHQEKSVDPGLIEDKENQDKSHRQVSVQWTGSAQSVSVTGSWTDWKGQIELAENDDTVWSANLLLDPDLKEIELKFIVDGSWVISPDMPSKENNVGTRNNYIKILH